MNFEQKMFMGFMAALLIGFIAFTLMGCKTAQKTESPEWHYNMGKQDAQKGMAAAISNANDYIRSAETERDDAREGWKQCEARLSECLEAGKDK